MDTSRSYNGVLMCVCRLLVYLKTLELALKGQRLQPFQLMSDRGASNCGPQNDQASSLTLNIRLGYYKASYSSILKS
jgi:hypothetical protein